MANSSNIKKLRDFLTKADRAEQPLFIEMSQNEFDSLPPDKKPFYKIIETGQPFSIDRKIQSVIIEK